MKPPLISVLLAAPLLAAAGEFNAALTLTPEWRDADAGSPYYVAPPLVASQRQMRNDLALRYRDGGLNAQGTLRNQASEGESAQTKGILNQLYFDGETNAGGGYTLGKKVLSWGVGQAFRPLDLIQREDRRQLNPQPLEGTPLLAWQRYDAERSCTLAWSNPNHATGNNDRDDPALAAYWYRLRGADDYHAVARLSRRHRLEAGGGWGGALGEEWSFHAAALYQRRTLTTLNALAENHGALLAVTDPMQETARVGGVKAVAGMQWTGVAGFGVLLEAWYDGEAWTRDEWRRLNALTASQHALAGVAPLPAIAGNIAWSSRVFERPNLLRENLMVRFSYDEDNWKTALEWLTTPRDGGQVIGASAIWQGDRQRVAFGLRHLGGRDGSAYADSPQTRMAYVEWRYALR
ncbi:MAG: hypothetical protein WC091_14065 [Sulfuricellaceae bacterium]